MEEAIPSERFRELLGCLASEHENEVRRLRQEVARLRENSGDGGEEVERLRAEVVRLQQYREEPRGRPDSELGSWIPLCRGCRDGNAPEVVEEEEEDDDPEHSRRDMSVVVVQPALSARPWTAESDAAIALRQHSSTKPYTRFNGSTATGSSPVKGRLSCGGGVPWDATGDVGTAPQWKDPSLIAIELEGVAPDELDLHGKEQTLAAALVQRKEAGDLDSMASEGNPVKVTDAGPLDCWKMFVAYARGHAQCKSCWLDAVSNWKKSQQSVNSLELGKMITILVPRNGAPDTTVEMVRTTTTSDRPLDHRPSFCTRVNKGLEVLVCHPNSRRRIMWDMLGVFLLMHDLVMLPMSAFNTGTTGLGDNYSGFQRVFDLFSSCFWTTDMGVSFLTGYFTIEGFTEMRPTWVARHYLRSWFPLDLFIVSVDWVSFGFSGLGTTTNVLRLGKTVSRFMRVLRLLRFMKLNTTMRDLLAMINSEYVLTLVNLMKILLGMVIMNHYLACCWYYLSVSIASGGRYRTWTTETFGGESEVRIAWAYSTSLHWSLTQFTPASMEVFPENEFERFFNIVVIIFALVIFSSFVSGITQAMTHIRNINSARMSREGEIRIFLASNKISHKLASRIWRCVRQNNTASLGQRRVKSDDIALLRMLPEPIKEDLRQEVYLPVLSCHPLFREYFHFDPDVVCHFCTNAVGEVSLRAGDHALVDWKVVKELLFVIEGTLEYHCPGGDEPMAVSKGQWACEPALWATRASLDGPLLAGATGAEVIKVSTDGIQKVAENHSKSSDFLGRYAKLFVHRFNNALLDDMSMPLFNDTESAELMIVEVLKQCGKARGISARRRKLSGKDLAAAHEAKHLLNFKIKDDAA